MVTVRFAPLPPKTMLAFGTRLVLDDPPLTLTMSPSRSPTLRFIVPPAPELAHVPPAAIAIVGGWLAGVRAGVAVWVGVRLGVAVWVRFGVRVGVCVRVGVLVLVGVPPGVDV